MFFYVSVLFFRSKLLNSFRYSNIPQLPSVKNTELNAVMEGRGGLSHRRMDVWLLHKDTGARTVNQSLFQLRSPCSWTGEKSTVKQIGLVCIMVKSRIQTLIFKTA